MYIILFLWEIKITEPEVNKFQLLGMRINQDIERLYISMHDSVFM